MFQDAQIPLYCDMVIVLKVNCVILYQPSKTPATQFRLLCEISKSCPHPLAHPDWHTLAFVCSHTPSSLPQPYVHWNDVTDESGATQTMRVLGP